LPELDTVFFVSNWLGNSFTCWTWCGKS